jgi:hypothetical protein
MGIREEVEKAWENVLSPLFGEFATEVQVQSVDVPATTTDPLYGEPADNKAFSDPVAIRARAKLEKERFVLPGGELIEIDGRVTVRKDELEAQGISMAIGSRIAFQGNRYIAVHREERAQVGDRYLLVRVGVRRES